MRSEPEENKYPEHFDRDYYDQLKAQYAHLENVHIFSKDDYEIDPRDTPWLCEDGGCDLKALRNNVAESLVQPGELDVAPDRPFRHTDLHTPHDIHTLNTRFQNADAVSGRVWQDPMPDSDFDGDEEWIDLRKVDDPVKDHDCEDAFVGAEPKPLKRKQYTSVEEEFAAVMESADRMQAENLDQPIPKTAWNEVVPIPDPDEFAKWQKAAEERGGNSTRSESHFLPPVKKMERGASSEVSDSFCENENELTRHKQHQPLIEAHVGSWTGELSVFSISGNSFSVQQRKRCFVNSNTSICTDGGLEWSSAVTDGGSETVSDVVFARIEHADALIPGRGVSSDGSYVQNSPGRGSSGQSSAYADISIGPKLLQAVTGNSNCKGELELCMMSGNGRGDMRRDRVLLCTAASNDVSTKGSRKSSESFAFVVLISEHRGFSTETRHDDSFTSNRRRSRTAVASSETVRGEWVGKGILLHPEFPPYACKEVDTHLSFSRAERITDDAVTWVEKELPDEAQRVSRGRQRTLAKKKVSKRVAAARAYDQKRLSECSFLCREELKEQSTPETHAWKAIPSEDVFTCLFSPRVGKFADDYCAIVLPNRSLLTFPLGKAFPDMWNTVSCMQLSRPIRKRITAGRNEFGDLVGVLFVTESVTDEGLCDEAAAYV